MKRNLQKNQEIQALTMHFGTIFTTNNTARIPIPLLRTT